MKFPTALAVLMAILVSIDMSAAAPRPPPKKRSPSPPPSPKPNPPAPPPGPFPALTFVGCYDLVSQEGYIASAYDKQYGVNFQDCYQWAIDTLQPLFAVTSYGECALASRLGGFVVDEKDNTTTSLKLDQNRCDAPCKGRTPNSPASQLKCGGARNPDSGNIASIYRIDFTKVQAQVSPSPSNGCPPVTAPAGPVAPTILNGKYRIKYVPYAAYPETYLGWDLSTPVAADSLLFAVDKTAPAFAFTVEKRAAIPCSNGQFYVWLTTTTPAGKFCATYRLDAYMWEPCAAGADSQLSILRPLPQAAGAAAMYEVATKSSGSCLYPLRDAAYTFTCGGIGAQLQFLKV